MTKIPDFLPMLQTGGHQDPSKGACLMEYVSMIAGETFSDRPACTDAIVSEVAIRTNDFYPSDDVERRSRDLTPFIPRLVNTTLPPDLSNQEIADIRWEQAVNLARVMHRRALGGDEGVMDILRALRGELTWGEARKWVVALYAWAAGVKYGHGDYFGAIQDYVMVLNSIAGAGLEELKAVLEPIEERLRDNRTVPDIGWQELVSQINQESTV